jgi:hypothetical protein
MKENAMIDIEVARKLCNEAAHPPWIVCVEECENIVRVADSRSIVADCGMDMPGDAAFIAASRTLLPVALDEIERLRAALTEALDMVPKSIRSLDIRIAELRKLAP